MPNPQIRRRFANTARAKARVQQRADGGGQMIVGYGAVFYDAADARTEYKLWDDWVERIMPGCFDEAIAEDDVRGMYDHEHLLARNTSGTMRLSVDQVGLVYEIDVPDTSVGRDVVTMLERGDLDGSSFAFSVHGVRGETTRREETVDGKTILITEIRKCQLYDVGPVVFPAYLATTAGVRSADDAELRAEYDQWKLAHEVLADDFLELIDTAIAEAELKVRA